MIAIRAGIYGGSVLLVVVLWYLTTDKEMLRSQLKETVVSIRHTQGQIREGALLSDEKTRKLEVIQSAIREARVQLSEAQIQKRESSERNGVVSGAKPDGASLKERLLALAERASWLDQQFRLFPELNIPEIQFLDESDWLSLASGPMNAKTPKEIRQELGFAVSNALLQTGRRFSDCLGKVKDVDRLTDFSRIMPQLRETMSDPVLNHYELVPMNRLEPEFVNGLANIELKDNSPGSHALDFVIRRKHPVDGFLTVFYFVYNGEGVSLRFVDSTVKAKQP